MSKTINYKGFIGTVDYSEEDRLYYGRVLGTDSVILYEGEDEVALRRDFEECVEDFIEMCAEKGLSPTPFKNDIRFHIEPDIYEWVSEIAATRNASLGPTIEDFLRVSKRTAELAAR